MRAESEERAGLRAADAAARAAAQRIFERPLVLEAGAGTGKTATLIARVVAWAMGPGWDLVRAEREAQAEPGRQAESGPDRVAAGVLEGLVAITFTDAAAAEMASRVGEALAAIESGSELPAGLDPELLPGEADERRQRARALLGALDRLVVRTIHAFCRRLLAAHPLESGLPPSFEVDADGEGLREVTHEVLEEALAEPGADEGAAGLLALVARGVSPEAVRGALAHWIQEGLPDAALEAEPLAPERIEAARRRIVEGLSRFESRDAGRLAAAKRARAEAKAARAAVSACLAGLASPLADAAALAAALRPATEAVRSRWQKWAAADFNKGESEILGSDGAAVAAALREPVELVRAAVELDAERLELGRRTLAILLSRARQRLRARGLVCYQDLLRLARELLASRPEIAAFERGRIRQLLVDEFQDTNRLQCELIELLALSGAAPHPGLFLVGDPKQSIYGWRSADLSAYERFVAKILAAGGEKHALSVNFRSAPPILDEVERIVAPVLQEEAGLQPPFEPLLACERLREAPGFRTKLHRPVEHWDSRRWDRAPGGPAPLVTSAAAAAENEAQALALDLKRLHDEEGMAWSDAAILLRSTGDQETYLSALREAGVPFAVRKDRSYYQRREIIEASALVRAVLDPHDQLALLTLLRSPLVGVPDAALIPLFARGWPERVAALWGADDAALPGLARDAAEVAAELPASIPGLERIAGWEHGLSLALTSLAALRASFAVEAPESFVERLATIFLVEPIGAARYLGAFRVANLERFLRELTEALADDAISLPELLRRLRRDVAEAAEAEEARPREAAETAVQVMTIHGAKGLQFGHVYLPRLEKKPPGRRLPEVAAELVDGVHEIRLFGTGSLLQARALERARRVEQAERVRLLYVALTRAEHRLVLLGQPAPPGEVLPLEVRDMAALLPARRGGWPDLDALGARAAGPRAAVEEAGALFVFPGLAPPSAVPVGPAAAGRELPAPELVRAGAELLRARRAEADERSRRPWSAAASAEAPWIPWESFDAEAERRFGAAEGSDANAPQRAAPAGGASRAPGRPPLAEAERRAAGLSGRAFGTAVHRVLELLDLEEAPATALERALALVSTRRVLAMGEPSAPAEEHRRLEAELEELFAGLAGGRCLGRLQGLGSRLVARELPLLMPPRGEALGFVSGSIDLVYRAPEDEAWVVADYKTDRAGSAEARAQRVLHHAPQLALYRQAVQEALGLPRAPRAEIWFLRDDAIETLP